MRPVTNPSYRPPKGLGYFLNVLARLDDWISRESHRDSSVHRFTKNQLRRIALYLEKNHMFNFDALRSDKGRSRRMDERARKAKFRQAMERGMANTGRWTDAVPQTSLHARSTLQAGTAPAPVQGRPRPSWDDQVREFKRIVMEEKKDLPTSVIDDFLL
jgi:hypothetical protein